MRGQNLLGQRFHRLAVIEDLGTGGGRRKWLCRCECGQTRAITTSDLVRGHYKSCGCLKRDRLVGVGSNLRHGMSRSRTYTSWASMRGRCNRASDPSYAEYGGRGVTVCARWDSFETFLEDMGTRPAGTTLDRIDSTGNYEPGNVRWATPLEQTENRDCTRRLEWNGENLSAADWARRLGMRRDTILARLDRGWTVERALTIAIGGGR